MVWSRFGEFFGKTTGVSKKQSNILVSTGTQCFIVNSFRNWIIRIRSIGVVIRKKNGLEKMGQMDLVNTDNNIYKWNGRPLLVYPTPKYVAVGVSVRGDLAFQIVS